MPAREILQLGNPVLFQRSGRVEDFRAPATRALVDDLADTLDAFRTARGFGRGIAAPQIGVLAKAVFIRIPPPGFAGPMFNPWIETRGSERFELWDDCLSFPDLMVRVRRVRKIRVLYQDDQGSERSIDADGDFSELLQHELDHLDGVLAVGRAVSPTTFCTREEWRRRYAR